MKLKLRLTALTRRCKCHTPGCRNRNAFKITRRNDVNGNPLFLCADCIRDAYAALAEHEAAETAKKQAIDAKIEAETKAQIEEKSVEEDVKGEDAEKAEETQPESEEKRPAKPRSSRGKA